MNKKQKVSIIIVSHNNKDILPECLDSILKQPYKNYRIYILDNDSDDGTKEFIQKNYPEVHFTEAPKKGPAEKRNIGISISNSEFLLFMDSDAQLTGDWLGKAIDYMNMHNDVCLLGGKILNKDGTIIDSAGGQIAKNFSAFDIGYGDKDGGQYESFKKVGYLKSATLMARRKMLKEIGGFDIDYFYDFEDTDLGLRANLAGWNVVYNPGLVSCHLGHDTMKKAPRKQESFMHNKNKISTIIKNYQFNTLALYSPFLLASFIYNILFGKQRYEILRAYMWNILNIKSLLAKREKVQSKRSISDKKLFDLIKSPLINSNSCKINDYHEFLRRIRSNNLGGLTFFITSRCNSRCKHCFYWKSLNIGKDLTLKEIEKILSGFYNINAVLLSGGEPFIRNDFVEIINLIIKYLNCKTITIPTNGLMGAKIMQNMEDALKKHPCVNFNVNLSLDGTESYHDYIRGIDGSFKKTIKVIKGLKKLKKNFRNLASVSVNTVITKENTKDLPKIIEAVKKLEVDDHFFDLIRGEHKKLLTLPDLKELKKINTLRYKTRKYYNKKNFKNLIKRISENLKDRHIIITQTEVLEGKKWPFMCSAGKTDAVVEHDGTLRICEFTPKIDSLLLQPSKILLESGHAQKIFSIIEKHGCDCTHICNLASSMSHSFKDIFFTRAIIDNFKKLKYFG